MVRGMGKWTNVMTNPTEPLVAVEVTSLVAVTHVVMVPPYPNDIDTCRCAIGKVKCEHDLDYVSSEARILNDEDL